MRHRTETTSIQIPPHILHRDMQLLDTLIKLIIISLTLGTTDDLANLREENIHRTNGLTILVLLHIECLDLFRIVCQDNRTLEMLLNQETLMLGSQVDAPINRELELMTLSDRLLKDLDTLRIR